MGERSRNFLHVSSTSPSKVPFTIERKVFDAVPPSLISRSLYESSGTQAGSTDFME